jgi:hypothetical protein
MRRWALDAASHTARGFAPGAAYRGHGRSTRIGLRRPAQPECARVALPGGFADFDFPGALAEFALPGALAELPRDGLALFSPLAGGANDGGWPELAGVGWPPPGGFVCDCGGPGPVSGDVDPVPAAWVWPAALPVWLLEAPGALLPAAPIWPPPRAGGEAIGDA